MIDNITLKDDYSFLVSDLTGEVTNGPYGYGLYYADTRYLSRMELSVAGGKLAALSHNTDYNIAATFHLSNSYNVETQLRSAHGEEATASTTVVHGIGIVRRRFVRRGLIESLEFTSYHNEPLKLPLSLTIAADFADIFEVRGLPHSVEGRAADLDITNNGQQVKFQAVPFKADLPRRTLDFESNITPERYEEGETVSPINGRSVPDIVLHYILELTPGQPLQLHLRFQLGINEATAGEAVLAASDTKSFVVEVARSRQVFTDWQAACTRIETGDYRLDKILETATLDLRSLMQQTPQGLSITAGLPWYFTLFGRDSLITGLQTLMLNPQIAMDTLRVLAAYQADSVDDWRDSEPGKILHEIRYGDITLSGEMPHSPYYGSIDSTLLFILCFAETLKWVDDAAFFAELWPNIQRALTWAEQYGDLDGDGYIEFIRRSPRGILHQGWKDSDESMGGAIGPRPSQPVALVEVQGYYYAALVGLAEALYRYGDEAQKELAGQLESRAAQLKANFNRDFWWEEEGFLVQALDSQKQPVLNVTSNPGHCLWSGIVDADKAAPIAQRLMQPDMLCGWGIRTMSALDPTYNPMSYHNGSIWPHDNALIIAGLRRYGFAAEASQVSEQILDAAVRFGDFRLPELYCGFDRFADGLEERAPAAYPVSCSPQAWAAGTPFLLLQGLLGIEPKTNEKTLSVAPILRDSFRRVRLYSIRAGSERFDLNIEHDPQTGNAIVNFM